MASPSTTASSGTVIRKVTLVAPEGTVTVVGTCAAAGKLELIATVKGTSVCALRVSVAMALPPFSITAAGKLRPSVPPSLSMTSTTAVTSS